MWHFVSMFAMWLTNNRVESMSFVIYVPAFYVSVPICVCLCLVTMCVVQSLNDVRPIWRGWTGDGPWGEWSAGSRAEVIRDRAPNSSSSFTARPSILWSPIFLNPLYLVLSYLSYLMPNVLVCVVCCLLRHHDPHPITTNIVINQLVNSRDMSLQC